MTENYITINILLSSVRNVLDAKYGVLLPSADFWDGNYALVNHSWNDILRIIINSYKDSNLLFVDFSGIDYNYYVSSYKRMYPIKEDLFQDRNVWIFWKHAIIRWWGDEISPIGEMYPDRWWYLNSWKNMSDTNPQFIMGILRYPSSPSYGYYITPFLNIQEIGFGMEWYKEYFKKDIYDIGFLNNRQLKHHDFVVGQYLGLSQFWQELPLKHNYFVDGHKNKVLGLSLFWYEKFGSVEFFLMLAHADWAELNTNIWWQGWSYRTIFDSYDFVTLDDGICIKSNYRWIMTLKDAPEFMWPDKTFRQKGINMYVMDYVYADKKRFEHPWRYQRGHRW